MSKSTFVERMEKKGAPKTWVAEVRKLQQVIKSQSGVIKEYSKIIDKLARQVEDLTPNPCESCCHEEPDACDYCSEDNRD